MELRRIGCADANQDLHLDAADRDALERCMLIAKRHPQPGEGSWLSCAQSACWGLQATALHLQPWETPPCTACEDDPNPRDKAATMLRKMLRAGLSRYEPDPLAALAKVKAKSKP